VAALEALLAVRELAEERVEIELLAPQPEFSYRPLAVAEPFGLGEQTRFDLAEIAADAGAVLRPGALASVDPQRHRAVTDAGKEVDYDILVVACGAQRREALPGAITFAGVAGRQRMEQLLADMEQGSVSEVVFALPGGCGWPFPLYELALLTAAHIYARQIAAGLTVVTPESAPLEIFGTVVSDAVRALLAARGIGLLTGSYPDAVQEGELKLHPAGRVVAERVVTLPRVVGPAFEGLPSDARGFIPVDRFGQVDDVEDVYAAGDVTAMPIKQGGLAAQQADVVAECIAERAGAPVEPSAFQPILRGLLLTGGEPRYLRADVAGDDVEGSTIDDHALWWPPGKIAGRRLAPYLAELAGFEPHPPPPAHREAEEVELEIESGIEP